MAIFNIDIGDPGGDGHDKTEKFTVNVNRTREEILAAYERAKKRSKVALLDDARGKAKIDSLFVEYEESKIPETAVMRLKELGVDFSDFPCAYQMEESDWDGSLDCDPEDGVRLFLEMVRTQLPGFTYDFIEYPNLVYGFGYGLMR